MSGLKLCPSCNTAQPIQDQVCARCGHRFRTNFAASGNQTIAFPSAPQPPVPYDPYGQGQAQPAIPAKRSLPAWAHVAIGIVIGALALGAVGVVMAGSALAGAAPPPYCDDDLKASVCRVATTTGRSNTQKGMEPFLFVTLNGKPSSIMDDEEGLRYIYNESPYGGQLVAHFSPFGLSSITVFRN